MTREEIHSVFSSCQDITEIKKAYFRLCLKWHPDRGGDTAIMQDINDVYDNVLAAQNGQTFSYKDTYDKWQQYTYRYNREREQGLKDKIAEVLAALRRVAAPERVQVLLVGSWLWIEGTSKEDTDIRAALKEMKFKWHSKRLMWYWHAWTPGKKRRYNSKASFESICATYGCEDVTGERSQSRAGGSVARTA